jgi:hypothetical protein
MAAMVPIIGPPGNAFAGVLPAYSNATARDTCFPIPIQEMSLNPLMVQNPGWN